MLFIPLLHGGINNRDTLRSRVLIIPRLLLIMTMATVLTASLCAGSQLLRDDKPNLSMKTVVIWRNSYTKMSVGKHKKHARQLQIILQMHFGDVLSLQFIIISSLRAENQLLLSIYTQCSFLVI